MNTRISVTHARPKFVVIVGAAAAFLAGAPLAAFADAPSVKPAAKTDAALTQKLAAKHPHGACAVIAQIDGTLTPDKEARLTRLGADITRHLGLIDSVALTLPARNLGKLAALPFVAHLSFDGEVKKSDGFTDASTGAAYARQTYNMTGKGVTVAVVDSGVQTYHGDLQETDLSRTRVIASPCFSEADSTQAWDDRCGHGSHVAGIIAGNGMMSTGPTCTQTFYGVAPQAKLVSVRVLNPSGSSTVAAAVAGLQWIVDNKNTYNIKVVNLSLGHPVGDSYLNDPLCKAVEKVWKSGIVVVCAAGNDGRAGSVSTSGKDNEGWGTAYGSIQSPANDPYVITVGATKSTDGSRSNDKIATYSSRGPSRLDLVLKPDIVAPGNKVVSLDIDYSKLNKDYAATNLEPLSAYTTSSSDDSQFGDNQDGAGYSKSYFVLSGTSMAAPVVAGAAALMLQQDPTLTPDTIKARLMVSADKWYAPLGTYQAEDSANTLAGGASRSSGSMYSGGTDVHNIGRGGTLQFNKIAAAADGSYLLTVAYVNGDPAARTASMSVNGAAPQTVSFPSTCTWASQAVGTVQVPITLKAGANTIKFSNPSAWTPDIDRVAISQADPLTFGAGYLNIPAALASSLTVTQPALSPALKQDSSGTVTIDTTVIASKALSGVSTIWGSKALSGVSTIYGSKALSGVSTVNSSKALSGSSVWGDTTVKTFSTSTVDLSSVAIHGE